jgi:TetR/AcrR family transcriptional regulator, mexJK operon transcriptional repressor
LTNLADVLGRAPASKPTAKQAAILEAATEVFLEQGFGNASMDEIARRANVSKATIYSHFDSKHALFGAIIQGRCANTPGTLLDPADDRPPEETLTVLARRFLESAMVPGSLQLYRVVLSEASRFPELGRVFYETGADCVAGELASYFEDLMARGVLAVRDPRVAAEQFIGIALAQTHVRLMLGIGRCPSPAECDVLARDAVRLFLDGARAGR